MLFLQILGAIVLVIIVLIIAFVLWFKFSLKRSFSIDSRYFPEYSLRIRLEATTIEDCYLEQDIIDKVQDTWHDLEHSDFTLIGHFINDNEEFIIAGQHKSGVIGLASNVGQRCLFSFYAIDEHDVTYLLTENTILTKISQTSVQVDNISIPHENTEQLLQYAITELEKKGELKQLTTRQWVVAYEQVYALCMDKLFSTPLNKEMMQRWLQLQQIDDVKDDELGELLEDAQDHFNYIHHFSLLENVRKKFDLDDDSWQRIEDYLIVVRNDDEFDDIFYHFNDDLAENLLQQFEQQNMSALQSFNAVNKRLDAEHQLVKIMSITDPVNAQVFIKPIYLATVDIKMEENEATLTPGSGLKYFLYQSISEDDIPIKASLVACNAADVKTQLVRLGHSDIRVLSSNYEVVKIDDSDMDFMADVLIDAQTDPLLTRIVKMFLGNWLIWGPFIVWSLYVIFTVEIFNWVDYLSFVFSALSILTTLYLTLPTIFYNALQEARSWGQHKKSKKMINILRKIGAGKLLSKEVLDAEEAKVLADNGELTQALSLLRIHKKKMEKLAYISNKYMIYDAARCYSEAIILQQKLVCLDPDNFEHKVELALALLRHTDHTQEAEKLLKTIHSQDCSEIFSAGLSFAQGLLLINQNQYDLAIIKLKQSLEGFQLFNLPLINAMKAEISGYLAICLQKTNKNQQADKIWANASPRLIALNAEHVLSRYKNLNL